jgi:hypothetical protein
VVLRQVCNVWSCADGWLCGIHGLQDEAERSVLGESSRGGGEDGKGEGEVPGLVQS